VGEKGRRDEKMVGRELIGLMEIQRTVERVEGIGPDDDFGVGGSGGQATN
jgi:hypothetical protein